MTSHESSSEVISKGKVNKKSLVDEIEDFSKTLLDNYKPQKITERKVIHDPILGSNIFEPYEIALIDSPFCQRLRRVSQTDVASLVYPSANHNRLEHSLGVATIASRILGGLKVREELNPGKTVVTPSACMEVRSAAILHDVGHGIFSHLSEETYQDFSEIELCYSQNPMKFSRDKPHEMISFLIVNSPSFQKFFKENIIKKYGRPNITTDKIANYIIPAGGKDDICGWQADIINGPFDADKFDYLQRDAYFSGLKIGIDLDRFLHCVWLQSFPEKPRQLKIMTSGATTLEQILFGKLMLNNTIYHHQKIRAAERAIRGIFVIIEAHPENSEYQIHGRKMNRAIDYLYVTEADILSLNDKAEELKIYIQRFLNRDLFKCALVISANTVIDPDKSPGYHDFKSLAEKPKELKALRQELVEALNGEFPVHELWIDLPQTLTFEDAFFARIQDEKGDKYLSDEFKISEWLTAYGSNKWKGYVFCPPGEDIRKKVGKKAAELLSDKYSFSINLEKALDQAKIR